MIFEVREMV